MRNKEQCEGRAGWGECQPIPTSTLSLVWDVWGGKLCHLSPQCARAYVCIWDKARNGVCAGAVWLFLLNPCPTAPCSVTAPHMQG